MFAKLKRFLSRPNLAEEMEYRWDEWLWQKLAKPPCCDLKVTHRHRDPFFDE